MFRALAVVTAALTLGACLHPQTQQDRDVHYSGFLGDTYRLLTPGGTSQAAMRYVAPDADFQPYHRILLKPVIFYRSANNPQRNLTDEEAQELVNQFWRRTHDNMARTFPMANQPGPDVLAIEMAVTSAEETDVALNVATKAVPQTRVATTLYNLVADKPAFAGSAQIEVKVTDSETGKLLAAGVDQRRGGGGMNAVSLETWGDVNHAVDHWVQQFAYNVCRQTGRAQSAEGCVPPEE